MLVVALLTDVGLATLAKSSRILSAIRTFGRPAFRCKNVFDDLRHFGFSRYLRARSRHKQCVPLREAKDSKRLPPTPSSRRRLRPHHRCHLRCCCLRLPLLPRPALAGG